MQLSFEQEKNIKAASLYRTNLFWTITYLFCIQISGTYTYSGSPIARIYGSEFRQ